MLFHDQTLNGSGGPGYGGGHGGAYGGHEGYTGDGYGYPGAGGMGMGTSTQSYSAGTEGYGYHNSSMGYHSSAAMNDPMAPRAVRKEIFVNVLVLNIEEENPLKHVSNWMGNLMRGNQYKGYTRANEIMPDIVNMIRRAIYSHGWDSDVQPVMLPPSHGQDRWAPFLRMGNDELPILMVFRVQLRTKLVHGNQAAYGGGYGPGQQAYAGGGLFHALFSCCEMFVSPWPISGAEYESIGMEIQDGLRRLRRAVRAQIEVVDAPGEYHILHTKGWTPELASQCILQSRNTTGGASSFGSGYGGNAMNGGMGGMHGAGAGGYGGHAGGYGSPASPHNSPTKSGAAAAGYGGGYEGSGYGGGSGGYGGGGRARY